MRKIELLNDDLQKVYLTNGKFIHNTGVKIKLMPFRTKFLEACMPDFKSFQGIVGECFRISNNKEFDKVYISDKETSFKKKLKAHLLKEVIKKVETDNPEEIKNIIIDLFFEEDGGLIKFSKEVLPFMNFIYDHNQLDETARFFYDIFLDTEILNNKNLVTSVNDNLFYQLIVACLPQLNSKKNIDSTFTYCNFLVEIKSLFLEDFIFISSNEETFLKNIEDLFKYYYFFYLIQLTKRFNSFGKWNKIKPIYFSMDWETLSESRLAYLYGWKILEYDLDGLFAHANTIEMLNYISIENQSFGDYVDIYEKWKDLTTDEQHEFIEKIKELSAFYTQNTGNLDSGKSWEKCEVELKSFLDRKATEFDNILIIELVSFFRRVQYQFKNSKRNKPYNDYKKWFIRFCKVNYTKTRGRLGSTTVINQELLLFLTKLCVGNEEKIRLNELWDKLKRRGLDFDEITKSEIIKLFERINLIEKKSDSGDAQYVKSII